MSVIQNDQLAEVAGSSDGEGETDGLSGEPKENGLWEGFGRDLVEGGPEVSEEGPRKSSTREFARLVCCSEFEGEGPEVEGAKGNWDSMKCTS